MILYLYIGAWSSVKADNKEEVDFRHLERLNEQTPQWGGAIV